MLVLAFLSYVFILEYYEKFVANFFKAEHFMKALSGGMILPKFGEYDYHHEAGSKPEFLLFKVSNTVAFIRKILNWKLILLTYIMMKWIQ